MKEATGYTNVFNRIVLIAGLGYFVDVYDIVLFGVVRQDSLRDLGVADGSLVDTGAFILNCQMIGMLVGGFLWGMLGDKRGRLSTLFAAIALYSVANIANAFVPNVTLYAVVRFIAGLGLAGELGAGVTLVSETMPKHLRGYGVTIVTSLGILGAVFAEIVAKYFQWQAAYVAGGIAGLLLLGTQFFLAESATFATMGGAAITRGDLRLLFGNRRRLLTYVNTVLIGIPVWYTIAVLVTFAPELGAELGVPGAVDAGLMYAWNYGGAALGGIAFGALSERIRSRKWSLLAGLASTALFVYVFLFAFTAPAVVLYGLSFMLGFATGYWPVFFTTAAEQFGTNLRATVTTTAANFVRGAVAPTLFLFTRLGSWLGSNLEAALIVGTIILVLGLVGVRNIKETYGTDLDYVEKASDVPSEPAAVAMPSP